MRLPELSGLQVVRSYHSGAEPKTELTQLPRRFTAAAAAAAAWRQNQKYQPLARAIGLFSVVLSAKIQ